MQHSYSHHPQQQNMYVQQHQQQMANVFTTMPMQQQTQQHHHQAGSYVDSQTSMSGGPPSMIGGPSSMTGGPSSMAGGPAGPQQHHVTTGAQGQPQPPQAAMYAARPGSGQHSISSTHSQGGGSGPGPSQDSSMDVVVISSGPPAASRMVDEGAGQQATAAQIQQGRTNSTDQFPPKLPSMVESANSSNESLPFRAADLDNCSPMALCTLGKDSVREIFNQSVEFFKILKQIQPAMQQMAGSSGGASIFRQNLEKQEYMQRNIAALFAGLFEISLKIDERFEKLVPKNADAQNLIPFVDNEHKSGPEKRLKQEKISPSGNLLIEHENLKKILDRKRFELDSVMQNLTQMCWDTSLLLLNE